MGPDESTSVTPLTQEQCLHLLACARTGRLGFHAKALPMLLPVDFAVDEASVVISVRAGSQADAATRDAVVAFQADGVHPSEGWNWSVSITGMATHIEEASEVARARQLLPQDVAGRGEDRLIQVSLDVVSGRRSSDGGGAAG